MEHNFSKFDVEWRLIRKRIIDPNTGCWIWTGGVDKDGYGRTRIGYEYRHVSRFSMFVWKDFDLDSELHVLHQCDNPRCFNPDHLFIGTQKDNIQDCIKKNRAFIGSKNSNSILTENQVLEIRRLFKEGLNRKELAEKFKVSYISICKIVTRKLWAHI